MNTTFKATALLVALTLGAPAMARPVDIAVKMKSYSGQQAYFAAYIVDANGQYVSTVLTAGGSGQYFEHISRWYRMFQRAGRRVDGRSGASIGAGRTMTGKVDIPDSMLNAGYTLRVETAVEHQRYMANDASVDLADGNNGKAVRGSGYVQSLTVSY